MASFRPCKILRLPSLVKYQKFHVLSPAMFSHKHRKFSIDSRRNYAICKPAKKESKPKTCAANLICKKEVKVKKKPFWACLFGDDDPPPKKKPPPETCRMKIAAQQCKDDPDLSAFGGQPYRTCGSAFVIQKDRLPEAETIIDREDLQIKQMEADPEFKDKVVDPMPPFETVELRLIELSMRKLHPFYKRVNTIKSRPPLNVTTVVNKPYKTRSGPFSYDDMPGQLKINRELLEKKNMFADYKRAPPPQQMVAKIVEMQINEKPTLGMPGEEKGKKK